MRSLFPDLGLFSQIYAFKVWFQYLKLEDIISNTIPLSTELLDGYKKLMMGAMRLEPVLHELESVHLSKFQTTWKIINQSMYYSYVYSDPAIQSNMPVYISLVSDSISNFFSF